MKVDLHCHSLASDGMYEPIEVYRQADLAGVELLALTDHDTVDGVLALQQASIPPGACQLLAGVEFSSQWRKRSVHVVGLGIDPKGQIIGEAVAAQKAVRLKRAQRIGKLLEKQGIFGAFDGAVAVAQGGVPCRPHFAEYLIKQGHCKDAKSAFSRYLGNHRLAGIEQGWPDLTRVVSWIVSAGGVAVLAHPEAYSLTRTKLRELVVAFCDAGGGALELAAPGATADSAGYINQLCREFSLLASVGSDFHGPLGGWRGLGKTRPVPADLTPVWRQFLQQTDLAS